MHRAFTCLVLALGLPTLTAAVARGQGAIGFAPNIGVAPDGVAMSAAPVVSADRRYVRLGVNANTFGFLGFDVVTQTVGAVGGGFGGGFGSVPSNFALSEGSPFNPNNLTPAYNGGMTVPYSKPVARAAAPPSRKAATSSQARSRTTRRGKR